MRQAAALHAQGQSGVRRRIRAAEVAFLRNCAGAPYQWPLGTTESQRRGPAMLVRQLLLRRGGGSRGAVVGSGRVPLLPLGLTQKSAGLVGSFPRLIGAHLSVLSVLTGPLGRLCRFGVLALRLQLVCPRSRQLSL